VDVGAYLKDPVTGNPYRALGASGQQSSANSTSVAPASDATFPTRYAPRNKAQSTVLNVGTSPVDLFPANAARTKLVIQNLSTAADPLHINVGANATTGAGSLRIASGATLELTGPVERVSAIATIAALAITAWEF